MSTNRRQGKLWQHRFAKTTPAELSDPLLKKWADWQDAAGRAEGTIKKRVGTVDRFARESGVSPVSACHDDLVAWFAGNRHLEPTTRAGYFEALNGWFVWLQTQEHRDDNPMLKMGKPKRQPGPPRPADDADLVRMLEVGMHHKSRVMILLAALEGMRVHEVAKVKGEDFNVNRNIIVVVGKGHKLREVSLHPLVITAAQTMPARGYWFPSRERFDSSSKAKPVNPSTVYTNISRAMRRAGAPGTPHSLRHWFGTTLLNNGASLRTVQELMGHQSVVSTQLYTLVPGERQHEAVATLDPWANTRAQLFKLKVH